MQYSQYGQTGTMVIYAGLTRSLTSPVNVSGCDFHNNCQNAVTDSRSFATEKSNRAHNTHIIPAVCLAGAVKKANVKQNSYILN